MKETTKKWLAKIAELNGVTEDEVLSYLRSLSSGKKVIHHLKLVKADSYFLAKG